MSNRGQTTEDNTELGRDLSENGGNEVPLTSLVPTFNGAEKF